MSLRDDLLVWIDLEMTGLDPYENTIIEIATIITDSQLSVIAEGPNLVINQSDEELGKMDSWNVSHHTSNGLIEKVRKSEINLRQAEEMTLDFLSKYCVPKTALLCGNTIGTDRLFLFFHMKELEKFIHYRSIDVTSIKELTRRWYPKGKKYRKNSGHRALDDIRGSIEELKLYRENFFIQ
ncbi:MAG: oligoribonuclease [Methanobacteriota archaeon]|nr:MAG: oligoribonuclease [Euryarchaeota archaeon]|tara:strand:+ start:4088 stop:4630 length:543 start_codon:yes stop_codon:yes gene_type:complete